ncbi:MAG: pilus assembly protein PilM [Lachnospiraceae bacterium]|nr:pilus assembly protein PilM [Lachnospiraceae bacterium]
MANKALTIYISSDAIRIAEMQKNNKDSVVLSNAAEIATPAGCFNDGYLLDVTAAAEAIRTAIFGRGFTAKDVVFTVSSKKIASKEVEINYFKNQKKLAQILQANSSEYFPMSNSGDYLFAYSILDDYYAEEQDGTKSHKYRVNAVAAPVDLVRGYYEVAEELKLNVKNIDYFGNSVIQLLGLQMEEGRTDLVLQIEKDATYVNVMRGKVLVLQRSVNYGKNAVTNALMDVKKISEKDAKTLLSNEQLLDQHVTADEYAEAVSYLVTGIGRAVEYHRSKNGDDLQGVKIFGEGSAIAGIEKILERELGAPVEHFETLKGVSIKGQAALTAEEVLRYLPNIGSIIDPMNLLIGSGQKQSLLESSDLIKYMLYVLVLAVVGSGIFTGITWYKHDQAVKERAEVQARIDAIADIEELKQRYDQAKMEYEAIEAFDKSSINDNDNILRFIDDLEKRLPKESYMESITFNNGNTSFTLVSGWHEETKNEVADVFVEIGRLPYVSNFVIPSFTEEYRTLIIIGEDEEGNPIYYSRQEERVDPESGEHYTVDLEPIEWSDDISLPEEVIEEGFKFEQQKQTTYSVSCHIGFDPVPAEPEEENAEGGAN